jgi:glycine betaine/choline ABC-type transport system substrate-binding protein
MRPLAFGLAFATIALSACGRSGTIAIGSKNFVEQLLLGELAAQQIERKLHVAVDRRFNLGGTLLAHDAIIKGDIDIYPEYTGTAITVVLREHGASDAASVYQQVRAAYEKRFRLRWLEPLGFNDTFAMVVRSEDAAHLSQPTLTAAKARAWRLGVGYEFLTREDGLQSLDRTYDLKWDGTPQSMDLGLLYSALEQKQIDMGAANSTDGQLAQAKFSALGDDKKTFPPYNACFVVREELLGRQPAVAWALGLLHDRVDDKAMRDMNRRVAIAHEPVARVIKDFLDTLKTAPDQQR